LASPNYVAVLASVPLDQIDRIRSSSPGDQPAPPVPLGDIELVASRIERCAHDVTGIEVFPLGQVLSEAIDVGQPLRNDSRHPLRPPLVVDPETVTARAMALDDARHQARNELGGMLAEALGADIDRVCDLYAHASRRGEAVVTFLAADEGSAGAPVPHVRVG
jgi:hypothetical protein